MAVLIYAALLALGVSAGAPEAHVHRTIATQFPAAQAAFDRGLLMLYAFNTGEGRAAFAAAERADPHAVIAYVGEALADTIDINTPSTAQGERRGADAVARGRAAVDAQTSDDDRALLSAISERFDLRNNLTQRYARYAAALERYARAHPADPTAHTWAAYAGWNATGRLTTDSDALSADAQTIVDDLDTALRLDPDDVGARHLRIHFWEQAHQPARARSDADYLAGLAVALGQSHLEHMAGHIYDRLGDYTPMIDVNVAACANDRAYLERDGDTGRQSVNAYHEHNVDFVLYGLTTLGRTTEAGSFAAHESLFDREAVALRAHDDRSVLSLLGAAVTPLRVIAEARLGALDDARRDLAALSGSNAIDGSLARAAVARAAHDPQATVRAYRDALAAQDGELGDPKDHWWIPVGEGLGAALLDAGMPGEAESVFRAELKRYPDDPRLDFGLARALEAQGHDTAGLRAAANAAWKGPQPLALHDLG